MSDEQNAKLKAEYEAEIQALSLAAFCERLRGVIRIPINDGAGPLNGSNEFVRQFPPAPIQVEAARRLELLDSEARALLRAMDAMHDGGETFTASVSVGVYSLRKALCDDTK